MSQAVLELPQATRRCWDCGVGSGPCQCTREFAAFEAWEEEQREAEEERRGPEDEWLAYMDELIP